MSQTEIPPTTHIPIYTGSSGQRIYRFPNGIAASVITTEPNGFEIAPLTMLSDDPSDGFGIDYHLGWGTYGVKRVQSEDEVTNCLNELASMPAKEKL